jgi:hypothetical protein
MLQALRANKPTLLRNSENGEHSVKTVKGMCYHAFFIYVLHVLIFSLDLFLNFIFDIIVQLLFQALRANKPTFNEILTRENIVKKPQKRTIY